MEPLTFTGGREPISSIASRTAVSSRCGSAGSTFPPGRPYVLSLCLLFLSSSSTCWSSLPCSAELQVSSCLSEAAGQPQVREQSSSSAGGASPSICISRWGLKQGSPHALCHNEEASSSFFWYFATHHGCCSATGQQQDSRHSQQWCLVSLPKCCRGLSCSIVAWVLVWHLLPLARHGEGFYHAEANVRKEPVIKPWFMTFYLALTWR